jgi:hypothetical protein
VATLPVRPKCGSISKKAEDWILTRSDVSGLFTIPVREISIKRVMIIIKIRAVFFFMANFLLVVRTLLFLTKGKDFTFRLSSCPGQANPPLQEICFGPPHY